MDKLSENKIDPSTKALDHIQKSYCQEGAGTPYLLLGDVVEVFQILTGNKEITFQNILNARTTSSKSGKRYPMCEDQPSQIDCRVDSCIFYQGSGKCNNVSPAITLNPSGKFVCWSKEEHPRNCEGCRNNTACDQFGCAID